MFVRTKKGKIFDCVVHEQMGKPIYYPKTSKTNGYINWNEVYKKSENIIDILEVGDYVNGLPIECVEGTWDDENDKRVYYGVATYGHKNNLPYHTYIVKDEFENAYDLKFRCIKPNEIKSIVTSQQFESISYKVGGSNE